MPWQRRHKKVRDVGSVILVSMVVAIGISILLWIAIVLDIRLGSDQG